MALDNQQQFVDMAARLLLLFSNPDGSPGLDDNHLTPLSLALSKAFSLCLKTDFVKDKMLENPVSAAAVTASVFFKEMLSIFDAELGDKSNFIKPVALPNPKPLAYESLLAQYDNDEDELTDDALRSVLAHCPNALDLGEDAANYLIQAMVQRKLSEGGPMVILEPGDFISVTKMVVAIVVFHLQSMIEEQELGIFKEAVD